MTSEWASPDVVLSTAVMSLKVEDASDPNRFTCVVHNRGYAIYFSRGIIPFNKLREGGELLDRILSSGEEAETKKDHEPTTLTNNPSNLNSICTTVSECNKKPNVLSVYKVKVKVLFSFKLILGPECVPVQDPTLYRSLAGGSTISHVYMSRFGTLYFGLHLYASATTSLVGYTDGDWAGCPSTCSAEAEYWGVANVVAETAWLRNLLRELHSLLSIATLVCCDNVRVLHAPSGYQYADIFTKGLPSALFEEFQSSLSVRPPPAPIARAY
ncbi:ribonuclease H-like domain-containing protein [Tanacetum coccineum]